MVSTADIINSYKDYLFVKYPSHHKTFRSRLKEHPESAKAEAVMFSIMRSKFSDVKIGEDVSTGGADFICISEKSKFIVEVTSLETSAVSKQSGLKNEIPENSTASWFSPITHMLRTKASGKADQVSGVDMPRVLAITTEASCGPPSVKFAS